VRGARAGGLALVRGRTDRFMGVTCLALSVSAAAASGAYQSRLGDMKAATSFNSNAG
jgi:hypothetical protein